MSIQSDRSFQSNDIMMTSSSSPTTNSSFSSFSDDCETSLPDPPPAPVISPVENNNTSATHGKKPVHKVEPIFDAETKRIRVFLEDGSLTEYSIEDSTIAEEVIEQMANRHSLGSDMRRYRLTLSEAQDTSWRAIRYIRPHQKLKEVALWTSTTPLTICTLRVVIVPCQVERLAESEPITFTYLYRQSINDYVRERAGSEISVDIAVQLTALLILDESLCTGVRTSVLVKRSWLLRQLFPRSLLDQFSMKQLINRLRTHLQNHHQETQLTVAKQFLRLFAENTRSFAGKLFPVKFPDKHRDSILLLGPRYPVAIFDQARRTNSPVVPLVSAWSHLSRVVIKQYRNGVAIRLHITPRTNPSSENADLLQQEISFLIHTNLLNDFMTFIEGYSQLESSDCSLAIERISHTGKSRVTSINQSSKSVEFSDRSPFVRRLLNTSKNHRTYRVVQEKPVSQTNPSLFALTRQLFTRQPTKLLDIDEQETISNVPNRTSLVTWRSLADPQPINSLPAPVLYRTVINVQPTVDEHMASITNNDADSDDDLNEPDIIDLTTSYGYYGSLSFPLRPPTPFSDGLVWEQNSNVPGDDENSHEEIYIWSPSTKQLSVHYNTNNSNNNNLSSSSTISSSTGNSWKRVWDRFAKRTPDRKEVQETKANVPYDFGMGEEFVHNRRHGKRVHWIDDDEEILNLCYHFVEHLKLFIQRVINDQDDQIHWKHCQYLLTRLHQLTDCFELQRAFALTLKFAEQGNHVDLLRQQTSIANLISRTILLS